MATKPKTHKERPSTAKKHEQHSDRRVVRPVRPDYWHWYNTRAWRSIRARQLAIEPLCAACDNRGVITPATVCDHVTAHKGDWYLFVDSENHQSLCASCHSRKTCIEDGGWGRKVRGVV